MKSQKPRGPGACPSRRDILRWIPLGGVAAAASTLGGCMPLFDFEVPEHPATGKAPVPRLEDFSFLQISDVHWGDAASDPGSRSFERAIASIRLAKEKPRFVVFTGDLTERTPDPALRRDRMKMFRELAMKLDVTRIHFLPGEHDADLDRGDAYREILGEPTTSFDIGGVHFVTIDNASDPTGALGATQRSWLARDLEKHPPQRPIVVFAHRPLLATQTPDSGTPDGRELLELLSVHENVTIFAGHIHRETRKVSRNVVEYTARSLVHVHPAASASLLGAAHRNEIQPGYRVVRERQGAPLVEERTLPG